MDSKNIINLYNNSIYINTNIKYYTNNFYIIYLSFIAYIYIDFYIKLPKYKNIYSYVYNNNILYTY